MLLNEKKIAVKQLVGKRFLVVGGRIRLIFSTLFSIRDLRKKLLFAVRKLNFDDLTYIENVDIADYAPSLSYSISPLCGLHEVPDVSDVDNSEIVSEGILVSFFL